MQPRAEQAAFEARLAAARSGDTSAWRDLYHELAPLIMGYLRAQRLPDAEDVAGEVMLELVRDLGRFRGDAANLRSWVLTIAHHRLLDARRHQARRPVSTTSTDTAADPHATDDPEAETLAAVGFGRLEPFLARLTEEQRTVLLLRVIGDLPIAEVARITGKRPGAVKQLQRRAACAMRRHLEDSATLAERSGREGQKPLEHTRPSDGDARQPAGTSSPSSTAGRSERALGREPSGRSERAGLEPSGRSERAGLEPSGRSERAGRTATLASVTPRALPTLSHRDGPRDGR